MVVGATRAQAIAVRLHGGGQRLGIGDHLLAVGLERRLQCLAERHRLARDHVHQRAALTARKHLAVDLGGDLLVVAQHQASARTAQRLVRGGGHHMRMRERTGMHAGSHQTRDVRDVGHQEGAHLVGDGAETLEIDHARIRAVAADDHLWLRLDGDLLDGVVVQQLGLGIEAVFHDVVEGAAEVGLQTMAQVAATLDGQAEHAITRIEQRHERRDVGVGAAVRLHIGELAAKQLLRAIARQILDLVVEFAAAVVALAGVALGVLVGHPAAHRVHHGSADMILAGDQFKRAGLTIGLPRHDALHLGIGFVQHGQQAARKFVERRGGRGVGGGVRHGRNGSRHRLRNRPLARRAADRWHRCMRLGHAPRPGQFQHMRAALTRLLSCGDAATAYQTRHDRDPASGRRRTGAPG